MKKILSILIALCIFTFSVSSFSGSEAENENSISFDVAVTLLKENSSTLKKLEISAKLAESQYVQMAEKAEDINTNGVHVNAHGMSIFIPFDNYTKMQLTKQKVLMPEQLKYAWEMTEINRQITEGALVNSLRDIYMGLYMADADLIIKAGNLQLAGNTYTQDKIRYEKGIITYLELEESEYNLLKAEKDLEAAKRSMKNTCRSFNSFIGVPVDTEYEEIIYEEVLDTTRLEELDYYVEKALAERLEITSIPRQIELKELEMGILEKNRVNEIYRDVELDYENLQKDIEVFKINLKKEKLKIENEIRNAYAEILSEAKNIENINRTLQMQNNNLNKLTRNYELGFVTKSMVDQTEAAVDQLINMYRMALFNYNTKIIKLENAAGIGPAYQKGM